MTLAELNALDRGAFVETIGQVFEHSPWVAERAWLARPFATLEALHGAMTAQVERASSAEQLALLRAHPDLGARARMSAASVAEQAGAGLDRLTAQEFERFHRLNTAYRSRFGFPFLLAVRGCSKDEILRALEARTGASPEDELREALRQTFRIAWFRLESLVE
jgi:2-oxo-4-hydroxy-4-carboxy-5-ureidoimidazoline decarboxylase